MRETAGQIRHTDEKLAVLIHMMDEWIRNNPHDGRVQ
jgi:hypothetical protein